MRKLSIRHENFLILKSKRGNCRNNNKMLAIRDHYASLELPSARIHFKNNKATLVAPQHFNLSQNAEEVLNFLCVLRNVASLGSSLYVDFTTIETLSPMCALLLTSEIDRWRLYGKKRLRVVDRDNWSPAVKSLLYQMGFNELINPEDTFYASSDSSAVRYLKLQSGTHGDGEMAEKLSENIAKMAGDIENSNLLYEGLTEAMINSKKWAYSDTIEDYRKRWWITASYNQSTGTCTVMIYDHGVGISQTIPRSGLIEHYKNILQYWGVSEPNDAYWIKAAMTVGRTSSGLKNRGKGLKDIQQFVLNSKTGLLRVLSGRGEYRIDHNGKDDTILHKNSLNGTLIAWQINTKEKT